MAVAFLAGAEPAVSDEFRCLGWPESGGGCRGPSPFQPETRGADGLKPDLGK